MTAYTPNEAIPYPVDTDTVTAGNEAIQAVAEGADTGITEAKSSAAAAAADAASRISRALVTSKGDMLAGTGADAVARVPVGVDGQYLVADAAAPAGVSWETFEAAPVLLGYAWWYPGTDSSKYLGSGPAAFDTGGLLDVTFTAPPSGRVIVRYHGTWELGVNDFGQSYHYCQVRDLAGVQKSPGLGALLSGYNISDENTKTGVEIIDGIPAGSHTWRWWGRPDGSMRMYAGPSWGHALLEVWSA